MHARGDITARSLKARLILGATVHLMHKGTGVLDEGRAHQRPSPVGSHALRRRLRVALVRHLMMPFAPCIMIEKEMGRCAARTEAQMRARCSCACSRSGPFLSRLPRVRGASSTELHKVPCRQKFRGTISALELCDCGCLAST